MHLPVSLHNRPRRVRLMAAAGVLLTTGLLAWLALALLTGSSSPKFVANNISRNYRACLINTQHDENIAQPVWSYLQKATHGSAINLQHITVPKSGTATSIPYINGLVQRHCGLIISLGPGLHTAITKAARSNPHQRFITIGKPVNLPNVQSYSPTDRSAAVKAVQKAAHHESLHRT